MYTIVNNPLIVISIDEIWSMVCKGGGVGVSLFISWFDALISLYHTHTHTQQTNTCFKHKQFTRPDIEKHEHTHNGHDSGLCALSTHLFTRTMKPKLRADYICYITRKISQQYASLSGWVLSNHYIYHDSYSPALATRHGPNITGCESCCSLQLLLEENMGVPANSNKKKPINTSQLICGNGFDH